jgi:hypothetical protein
MEPDEAVAQNSGFDRACLAALVVDHHAAVRVENEIALALGSEK